MTRALAVVDGADAGAVLAALRQALTGDGPAVFPAAEPVVGLPAEVPRAIALVVQTSGSSGAPKRVALSADALLASAAASASALGGSGQWLLALPAHYIAGANVLVRSIAAETEPVVLAGGHFDAHAFATAADRLDADLRFTSLVPAQLARVVEAAEVDAGVLAAARRLDRILVGGQATPPELIGRAADLGLAVTRTYGSSETSGGCVYDGVPIGDTRVRTDGGVVELSGPTLAWGYLGDAERTAEVFVEHDGRRWYRTGDVGELTDGGRLRILGRADNVIVSGGIKVSLDAVERVAHEVPGWADAVVVGAGDARWGQVPVVVTTGTGDFGRLRDAVGRALGVAARPGFVVRVDRMPLLASGKPDRPRLAELAAQAGR